MSEPNPVARKRVLYEIPGSSAVSVQRDLEFPAADGAALAMDVYRPPGATTDHRTPAVVIVTGFPGEGFQRFIGCPFKDMESVRSWGRLMAASGMVAIAYTNRDPAADVDALLRHLRTQPGSLGIDDNAVGIWASSGNVPVALSLLMDAERPYLKCAAICYPYTMDTEEATDVASATRLFKFVNPNAGKSVEDLRKDVPLLVVRAGQDQMPGLNIALDRFVARALARDLPLTLVNQAVAPHAFDLDQDTEDTRETIRNVLAFLRFHLLKSVIEAR